MIYWKPIRVFWSYFQISVARLFHARGIVLKPKDHGISFCGPHTLNQFEIMGVGFDMGPDNQHMTIKITLKRLLGQHMLATFFPTICIMMISCMTLIIDIGHFEASIMVALTAMLVMHTLYQSTADMLPKTGNIKLIDIWLMYGLVLPFVVFSSLIIVRVIPDLKLSKRSSNSIKLQKMVQNTMMAVLMVITIMFVIGFFMYAFSQFSGNDKALFISNC